MVRADPFGRVGAAPERAIPIHTGKERRAKEGACSLYAGRFGNVFDRMREDAFSRMNRQALVKAKIRSPYCTAGVKKHFGKGLKNFKGSKRIFREEAGSRNEEMKNEETG
jgi:hypothetical protein